MKWQEKEFERWKQEMRSRSNEINTRIENLGEQLAKLAGMKLEIIATCEELSCGEQRTIEVNLPQDLECGERDYYCFKCDSRVLRITLLED